MKRKDFDIKKIKKSSKGDCFICKHKFDDEEIVFEDEKFITFLDLYPPTKGYSILAPKKHFTDITDMSESEYLEFQRVLFRLSDAIKKALRPKRICLLNSGALLAHWHFHIIPMYNEIYDNFIDVILKKSVLKFSKTEKKEMVMNIRKYLKL